MKRSRQFRSHELLLAPLSPVVRAVLGNAIQKWQVLGYDRIPQAMNENILLVEDQEALRTALSDRLRRKGYVVESAANSETGFQKAISQSFDLMIFDVVLPRRSGLDLCRDIRRAGLGTPILMLTARRAPEDSIAGFNAGADAYMTKPFDMLELSARVEALLRRWPVTGSNIHHSQLSALSTRQSRVAESGRVSQDAYLPLDQCQSGKSLAELDARLGATKNSVPLDEVVPWFRMMLDKERKAPQTHGNAALRSFTDNVIEFLDCIFAGMLSGRQPGTKEM